MRVAPATPATWRGRGPETLAARHRVAERARDWYRRVTDGPGVMARLRSAGSRWVTRTHKARSDTQSPSGLERALEDLCAFVFGRADSARLHELPVLIGRLLADLDERPVDATGVLAAIESANLAEARANVAEQRLICRAHRRLDEGDVAELVDRWQEELAAKHDAFTTLSAFLHGLRLRRTGLALVPAGGS